MHWAQNKCKTGTNIIVQLGEVKGTYTSLTNIGANALDKTFKRNLHLNIDQIYQSLINFKDSKKVQKTWKNKKIQQIHTVQFYYIYITEWRQKRIQRIKGKENGTGRTQWNFTASERCAHTNARSRTENKDKKTQIIYCNKWQTQRWETFGMLQHMKSFPIG